MGFFGICIDYIFINFVASANSYIMKRSILLLLATSWLLAACSPVIFQQIATLSSENVELKNDGSFAYEDAMVTIEYDFWSESGKFYFLVKNNFPKMNRQEGNLRYPFLWQFCLRDLLHISHQKYLYFQQ